MLAVSPFIRMDKCQIFYSCKLRTNSKKSEYVRLEDIPEMHTEIERGRTIEQLERRLKQLNAILTPD